MHVFTHFDGRYKPFGRALLESLQKHHPEATLHVLALDEDAVFESPSVRWHSLYEVLHDFGTSVEELRTGRAYRDVCWLLEPIWCCYAVSRKWADSVIYTDADTFLFSRLDSILDEVGTAPIALTPHRFPNPEREQHCGKYNFGFGVFRCEDSVSEKLRTWADDTLKAPSGYGGQRLLDSWHVHEIQGAANLGPWSLPEVSGDPPTWNGKPLVHVHMHEFRRGGGRNPVTINGQQWNLTNYPIHPATRQSVYEPYLRTLEKYVCDFAAFGLPW